MIHRVSKAFLIALLWLGAPITAASQTPVMQPDASGLVTADSAARALKGYSGALRAAIMAPVEGSVARILESARGLGGTRYRWIALPGTRTVLLGEPAFSTDLLAPEAAGFWKLEAERPSAFTFPTFISQVPFAAKQGGMLNGYHIGTYPTEGIEPGDPYSPPDGFIEVTPENQDFLISEHFRLRQFLTKDQATVWPKYLAIRPQLIDKLELVMQELNRMGIRAEAVYVMSGFRTPQYNGPGGDGRAQLSRHMYGDAADVWIDNDGDGYIDDLNGDGNRDTHDADLMMRAVERVERKYPELLGGAGVYGATTAHGPFIHIDVRGTRARW